MLFLQLLLLLNEQIQFLSFGCGLGDGVVFDLGDHGAWFYCGGRFDRSRRLFEGGMEVAERCDLLGFWNLVVLHRRQMEPKLRFSSLGGNDGSAICIFGLRCFIGRAHLFLLLCLNLLFRQLDGFFLGNLLSLFFGGLLGFCFLFYSFFSRRCLTGVDFVGFVGELSDELLDVG